MLPAIFSMISKNSYPMETFIWKYLFAVLDSYQAAWKIN